MRALMIPASEVGSPRAGIFEDADLFLEAQHLDNR